MPLRKSTTCDVPTGFPMSAKDLPEGAKVGGSGGPVLDLETFVKMAKEAYGTGHIAFLTADKDENGSVSPEEFEALSVALGLEPGSTEHLFDQLDADGDGAITNLEWTDGFGVSLDGLRERIL